MTDKTYIAEAKMLRVWKLIKILMCNKLNIHELSAHIDTSVRTTYRYLMLIEFMGVGLESDFDNRYFITDNKCPVCNKHG